MNITFVGCGNVATVMARLCQEKGHNIQHVIARNKIAGGEFAQKFKCDLVNFNEQPNKETDLVIVALSDNSLPEAINNLNFGSVPVIHTAGSCNMNVLENMSKNFGVLYPLQTLRKEMETIPYSVKHADSLAKVRLHWARHCSPASICRCQTGGRIVAPQPKDRSRDPTHQRHHRWADHY